MDHATIQSAAQYFVVAAFAFGALLLVALAVRTSLRWRLAAFIGLLAGMMMNLQGGGQDWLLLGRDMGLGLAGGLAGVALGVGVFWLIGRTRFGSDLESMRVMLNPHEWQEHSRPVAGEPAPAPLGRSEPLGDQDIARRWFVAIAAAVGSVVFSLISSGGFWQALQDSLTPVRFGAAAFLVAVAVVLVGPIQDFVFDRSLGSADGSNTARMSISEALTRDRSRRSALRLILVFSLALVLLQLLSNSLEASIVNSAAEGTLTILLASVTPAIVSYYWCAALQLGVPRGEISYVSSSASTTCCAVVAYLFGVGLCAALAAERSLEDPRAGVMVVLSPLTGIVAAGLFGYFTAGIYARFGGWALQYTTGWRAMAGLGAALLLGSVVHQSFSALIVYMFTESFDWAGYLYLAIGAIGWLVGLIASGFPKIVMNYPNTVEAVPAEAAAGSKAQ